MVVHTGAFWFALPTCLCMLVLLASASVDARKCMRVGAMFGRVAGCMFGCMLGVHVGGARWAHVVACWYMLVRASACWRTNARW